MLIEPSISINYHHTVCFSNQHPMVIYVKPPKILLLLVNLIIINIWQCAKTLYPW